VNLRRDWREIGLSNCRRDFGKETEAVKLLAVIAALILEAFHGLDSWIPLWTECSGQKTNGDTHAVTTAASCARFCAWPFLPVKLSRLIEARQRQ